MWFDNSVYKKVIILEQPEGFSEISPNTENTKSFDRNSVLLSKQNWFRWVLPNWIADSVSKKNLRINPLFASFCSRAR